SRNYLYTFTGRNRADHLQRIKATQLTLGDPSQPLTSNLRLKLHSGIYRYLPTMIEFFPRDRFHLRGKLSVKSPIFCNGFFRGPKSNGKPRKISSAKSSSFRD